MMGWIQILLSLIGSGQVSVYSLRSHIVYNIFRTQMYPKFALSTAEYVVCYHHRGRKQSESEVRSFCRHMEQIIGKFKRILDLV